MNEKIDIVYTWVDGSDPMWRKKRYTELQKLWNWEEIEQYWNVEWRFRDNDELRYSLRSLEKYFPEHGEIYIVTDHQIPSFLKIHPKVHIIFHEDFMNPESLPTFSSKNIEASLVHIPNLSEKFLYFNDDVFLGPDFNIWDMFTENKSVQYLIAIGESGLDSYIPPNASAHNILKQVYENYMLQDWIAVHVPKAIEKSYFLQMKQEFLYLFDAISYEKFRYIQNPSLLSDFYVRWMLYHRYSTLWKKKDVYIQSTSYDYQELFSNFENIAFFCINDTGDNVEKTDPQLLEISRVLERLFPDASKYEKP